MSREQIPAHAIILAGGRGTRFWPRSRARRPKQLLNIVGDRTMLQQTVDRLRPAFAASNIWIVTNDHQAPAVRRQLPHIVEARVLVEPFGCNTAAAMGLAAIHLMRQVRPGHDALMAVLPADHYIGKSARYLRIARAALTVAARGQNLVVLGVPPTRPETGYGYIERAGRVARARGFPVYAVRRFTEKPELARARKYVASRRYDWNAGMFFWRVSTFLENLKRFLPDTYWPLLRLADSIGTPRYTAKLRHTYGQLRNISVDYAIMEPATQAQQRCVFVLPAEVGWSDIGSWAAVYELAARRLGQNVSAGELFALDAEGNYLWSPEKLVAAIGVRDLVVVDTHDALLICPRDRAQDVGKIVKWLEQRRQYGLL